MRIDAVATTEGPFVRSFFGGGPRRSIDAVARRCLEHGRCEATELDLIVSVGIYKEHGLAEPAFAALLQDDIGANPGADMHLPSHGHGTFSFDLMNGGCGVVTALHVIDGFLSGQIARTALIVAADVEPLHEEARHFPYVSGGGALLLRADGPGRFHRFAFRTFPEHADLFDARIEWDTRQEKNVVVVDEHVTYAARCVPLAADVARHLLAEEGLSTADVDLLIASQYPLRFPLDLAGALELSPNAAPAVETQHVAAHTAGPLAALDAAVRSGRFEAARRILFVTVGAGISVAAALYERAPTA